MWEQPRCTEQFQNGSTWYDPIAMKKRVVRDHQRPKGRYSVVVFLLLWLSFIIPSCTPENSVEINASSSSTTTQAQHIIPDSSNLQSLGRYILGFNFSTAATEPGGTAQNIQQLLEVDEAQDLRHVSIQGLHAGEAIAGDIDAYISSTQAIFFSPLSATQPCTPLRVTGEAEQDLGFFHLEDIFTDIILGNLVDENVMLNGFMTKHYQVENIVMKEGTIESQRSEVWLEQGSQMVVAFMGYASGNFSIADKESNRLQWEYQLQKPDERWTLSLPEECTSQQRMLENFPLPDDIERLTVNLDLISYTTTTEPAEMADFYQAALPPLGWALTEDLSVLPNYILRLQKDEKILQMVISPHQPNGSFVVISPVP